MTEFLERLRGDAEPTRTALAMADAIHQHITDLLEDEPSDNDGDVLALLRDGSRQVAALRHTLRALTGGAQ
jgi:hypothetical protein